MLSKSRTDKVQLTERQIDTILNHQPTQANKDMLGLMLNIAATKHPVALSTYRNSKGVVPNVANQIAFMDDLFQKTLAMGGTPETESVTDPLTRFRERSTITAYGQTISLGFLLEQAKQRGLVNSEAPKFAGETADVVRNAKMFMYENWLPIVSHTQSIETVYMAIDNPAYLAIAAEFQDDPRANITFCKNNELSANKDYQINPKTDMPSNAGFLTGGIRVVIFGDDATTPSSFIQSVVFMAKKPLTPEASARIGNVEDVEAYIEGKALLDSMPALQRLTEQAENNWDDRIIPQDFVSGMKLARKALQEANLNQKEYLQLARDVVKSVGEYARKHRSNIIDSALGKKQEKDAGMDFSM